MSHGRSRVAGILALSLSLIAAGWSTGLAPASTTAAAGLPEAAPTTSACPARTGLRPTAWSNPLQGRIVSPFGTRTHPVLGYEKLQPGVDVAVQGRAPVRAMGAGVVTVSEASQGGLVVSVDHGAGVVSSYRRLASAHYDDGDIVDVTDVLGRAPRTGTVRIGVTVDSDPVDPQKFLATRKVELGVTKPTRIVGKQPEPEVEIAPEGTGRSGTGLALGSVGTIDGPLGAPIEGSVSAAVANIPNRSSASGFSSSMRSLAGTGSDFILLNEVGARSIDSIRGSTPGYGAYRDPVVDRSVGGVSQSMNNVVLWRSDTWRFLDGGRVKVVNDDRTFHQGQAVTWDRYATWGMVQREDGAVVSLISTHMMTNAAKYPRQHGNPSQSRVGQFGQAMDIVIGLADTLSAFGPVIVGGDMNSHGNQGSWTAEARMRGVGYGFAKDSAVMYLFHPPGSSLLSSRVMSVASDHPAVVASIGMNGLGPGEAAEEEEPVPEVVIPVPKRLALPQGSALDQDQIGRARTIIARTAAAGLPREAAVVAVAAALTESGLDPRSDTGLFAQRADDGWGTAAQVTDTKHATDAFLGVADVDRPGLTDLDWAAMSVGDAAAGVQGGPFPESYQAQEPSARFIVQQLSGTYFEGYDACGEPAVGTCPATPWAEVEQQLPAAMTDAMRCISEEFEDVVSFRAHGDTETQCLDALDVGLTEASGPARRTALGDAVADYLGTNATQLGVRYLLWNEQYWAPDGQGWRPYPAGPEGDEAGDPTFTDHLHVALGEEAC
ncbi:peptidoglycan DD-metalloendopeptidase family protein [Nocardioides sambongensis]|uniref:peptidoglycan DD-metalloendopeptidase family protein n=1 Tax=Nocardioides sambongensis TaxID=2589074 RepID=UPI00112AD661|nr:peptidoglycan DD-metalloendopeptidase family protein [Nocardioides sambongensis]